MGRKCDILYIHSSQNPLGEDNVRFAYVPMGLIGILNNLRSKGYEVIGVNYAIERSLNPHYQVDDTLREIEYKVLLTDLHWYMHAFGAMYIAERSKAVNPHIPVVIGGYTTTIYAQEILENFPCVDYAVTGDSDLPNAMLMDSLLGKGTPIEKVPNLFYRKDGKVVRTADTWVQTSLDDIDFITADYFDHADKLCHVTSGGVTRQASERWIEIARGCKFNCAYCCGANANMQTLFNRCNILLRSPEKVAEDFCRLEREGIYHVAVSHDPQMFGKEYYHKLFAEIRKQNVKPGLYLECFQLPTKDFIDDMLQTFNPGHILLAISPISGNEELRRKNGKLFSNDALYETVEYLLACKLKVQLYYTLNLVGETEEEFLDSYMQMKYLNVLYGMKRNHLLYQRVVIDPLAGMREFPEITVEYNTFMDYYRHCQLPTRNYEITGYTDGAAVSATKKMEMYESIFTS